MTKKNFKISKNIKKKHGKKNANMLRLLAGKYFLIVPKKDKFKVEMSSQLNAK